MANETTDETVEDQVSTDDNPGTDEGTQVEPQVDAGNTDDDGSDLPPEVALKELKAARAEAAKYRTQLREVQESLSKAKTVDEFNTAITELSDKNVSLERELVAAKFNLPDALAGRLQGSTREELEEDAKSLSALVRTPAQRDLSGGLDPRDPNPASEIQAAIDAALKRSRVL